MIITIKFQDFKNRKILKAVIIIFNMNKSGSNCNCWNRHCKLGLVFIATKYPLI